MGLVVYLFFALFFFGKWEGQDLNLRPIDYQSIALASCATLPTKRFFPASLLKPVKNCRKTNPHEFHSENQRNSRILCSNFLCFFAFHSHECSIACIIRSAIVLSARKPINAVWLAMSVPPVTIVRCMGIILA